MYVACTKGDVCPICKGLDDKHFKVDDMMPGENAPPMHNVELSLTFGLEGKGVDGYATVTAEQQEVAAYVFADTQKTGA